MNRIVSIAQKSDQYLRDFALNVQKVLHENSDAMVDMNRAQMLSSLNADGGALVHAKTGSARLSRQYARRTGKSRPDLFLTGDFQNAMAMNVPNEKEYFITSENEKTKWLTANYGNIFGIAPRNQPVAQAMNTAAMINDYIKNVLQ